METSILNQILDQHQLWASSNGEQGSRANLTGADLGGADLRRADLRRADLYYADLRGASLTGANLMGADLLGANLTGAILTGADLCGANLWDANLTGAILTGANLTRAYFDGAILTGANLEGANLEGAILTGAYLHGTIGLPDISWIIPGCLVQLNRIKYDFYLSKEDKWENFIQDSFGLIVQNNGEEGTFDMLLGDRIIRDIRHWVKLSGLKQIESV